MLKKNLQNEFNVSIILNGEEYTDQKIFIEYIIDNKKKQFYKISIKTDLQELKDLNNFFGDDWIEGVKGFGKHIISDNKYHMVYYEKKNLLELITFDNSMFFNGKLLKI